MDCHDYKKGDVFECQECGMQLQVITECKNAANESGDCVCHDESQPHACMLSCCGHELQRKS